MKGIVLARRDWLAILSPLTRVTNKHLLPVYDKPMIFYPLQILVDAGIRDILIVTGGHNAGDFLRLLQNGKEFGLQQELKLCLSGRRRPASPMHCGWPNPGPRATVSASCWASNIIEEGDIKDAAAEV